MTDFPRSNAATATMHEPNPRPASSASEESSPLVRGLTLRGATALNMIDMIGVGPFITMPLIIGAMGGPQAMIGWVVGALFAACDGLIWAGTNRGVARFNGQRFTFALAAYNLRLPGTPLKVSDPRNS